jgi:UDP-glucuronate decarboxylase
MDEWDMTDSKQILVTGGAGFLGSHLCEQVLKPGVSVICVDNLVTGSLDNINHLSDDPGFQFIRHDIVKPLDLKQVNEIYNFACPASPPQYQINPVQTLKTCVYGAVNMLDLCHQSRARILQASTSEVYGDPEIHPQHESYVGHVNPLGSRACYEEGKRAAETLCFDYFRQYKLSVKIARLFNVYGPRMQMDDGRVIPNFILQALQNQPVTIYGDGMQTRSFCYVDDVIQGIVSLMATASDFTGPVNIGSTGEIAIVELAETIIAMIGSRSRLVFKDKPQDDPSRRRPDIKLAHDALSWVPMTSLEQGLKRTISYFDGLISSLSMYNGKKIAV